MLPHFSFSAVFSLAFFAITYAASVHAKDIFVTPIAPVEVKPGQEKK